ncbi:MAG: archaeal proteasome endopeptidase complex subunit beta [Candidatus Anstonellales archaeon]
MAEKKLKTGTTTVAISCKDGVVLASDRRATMGYYIASKDIDKIFPLGNTMAMTVAGVVGDAQLLVRWMQGEVKAYALEHEKGMTTKAAVTLLSNVLSRYKFYPYFVQLILAGYTEKNPEIYSIDMSGGITKEKYTATGSGSTIAIAILEEHYKEGLTVKEAKPIAAKAVLSAIKRDAGSGENVDLIYIDKDGFHRVDREEVKKLLAE